MKSSLHPLIFPEPRKLETTGAVIETLPPLVEEQGRAPAGGYRLSLGRDRAVLAFADEPGRLAGRGTWSQLATAAGNRPVPALEIEDYPELAVRGFMLDISRGRVPRRSTLRGLVDLLRSCRYNQLQLYMEHTFAYPGHGRVWRDAAPLTGDDIRWLDELCRHNGIELVPNQNCFGHMENWLRYPEYHYLAECPEGFHHPHAGWKPSGSVLKPGPESLAFIDGLLDALLPCFSSGQVNIGCDETWELGQGASREAVSRSGLHGVFSGHLRNLVELARKRGKRVQFWADVFLSEEGAAVPFMPDALPVVWGYEAGHPFDPAMERLSAAGYPFLAAPGTSCWNSFGGRWTTARENIPRAVKALRRHRGDGMVLTSWGDNGHGYPFVVMIPPILLAAACAWSGSCSEEALQGGFERAMGAGGAVLGDALCRLGSLDRRTGTERVNMSGVYLRALAEQIPGSGKLPVLSPREAQISDALLGEVDALLSGVAGEGRSDYPAECRLALDLTRLAVDRAAGRTPGPETGGLRRRFRENWERTSVSPFPDTRFSGLFPRELG